MFWKRSADPMVLLTSLMLITIMATFAKSSFAAMSTVPELEWIVRGVFFFGFGSFVLVFALFPNGRSVPAMAWIAAPVLATIVAALPGLPRVLAMFPDRPPGLRRGDLDDRPDACDRRAFYSSQSVRCTGTGRCRRTLNVCRPSGWSCLLV